MYEYNYIIKKLRNFFQDQHGFIEIPTQERASILAACEDPATITTFTVGQTLFPLPQTGQMWLEHELLKNPSVPGVFCVTTSYRDEPHIIPGRHKKIFQMFEFESHGSMEDLALLESKLLAYLELPIPCALSYEDACAHYKTSFIESDQEARICKDFNPSVLLKNFPQRTHPFWNMKKGDDGLFKKIDVILYGMETIGSAERSTNPDEMRELFFTISDGGYAELLFSHFGKDRVLRELDEFLSFSFFQRFGGGIGVYRLEQALRQAGMFDENISMPAQASHMRLTQV